MQDANSRCQIATRKGTPCLYNIKCFAYHESDALDRHARARRGSIEFIRETMVRSASFTAVPGQGGVAMGAIGVLTAVAASRIGSPQEWLATWLIAAVVAAPIGLAATIVKARRNHVALWSASGRRFMQGFLPAIVAGAALTAALVRAERIELLAPM